MHDLISGPVAMQRLASYWRPARVLVEVDVMVLEADKEGEGGLVHRVCSGGKMRDVFVFFCCFSELRRGF
jgi:hypothetical protein